MAPIDTADPPHDPLGKARESLKEILARLNARTPEEKAADAAKLAAAFSNPLPRETIRTEGTCPACRWPVRVTYARRYTGGTKASAEHYDADQAAHPNRFGFNMDAYQRAHPAFTEMNSEEFVADQVCSNPDCRNVRFRDGEDQWPDCWVRTDRHCSSCGSGIVEEYHLHVIGDPKSRSFFRHSCEHCRLIYAELPPKKD